jgi:hypothetical protein
MLGECLGHLQAAGVSWNDAQALRRIAMTLHRWHELECGDGNAHASWCLTRGYKRGKSESLGFRYDDAGKPFIETHRHSENVARYTPVADRERGALKRLGKIMAGYPGMTAYVQGDPRGAALYILRPGDVPEGADVESCYNRGVAVYK